MPVDVTAQFSGMSNEQIVEYFNEELSNNRMTLSQADNLISQLAAQGIIISNFTPPISLFGNSLNNLFGALNAGLEVPIRTNTELDSETTTNIFQLFAKRNGVNTDSIGNLSTDDIGIILLLMGQEGRNDFVKKMQESLSIAKDAHRIVSERINALQRQISTEQAAVLEEQKDVNKTSEVRNTLGFWVGVASAVFAVAAAVVVGGPVLIIGAVCAVVGVLVSVCSKGLEAKAKGETGLMASLGSFVENTVGVATQAIAGLFGAEIDKATAAEIGLAVIGAIAAVVGLVSGLCNMGSLANAGVLFEKVMALGSFIGGLVGMVTGAMGVYVGIKSYQLADIQYNIDVLKTQRDQIEIAVEVIEKTLTKIREKISDFINSLLEIEKLVSEESQQKNNANQEIIYTI